MRAFFCGSATCKHAAPPKALPQREVARDHRQISKIQGGGSGNVRAHFRLRARKLGMGYSDCWADANGASSGMLRRS
jgi:hypothetical protein